MTSARHSGSNGMGNVLISQGNIFDSPAHVLVCPVNCEGTMGAGLALEFSKRYPGIVKQYKELCTSGMLEPGAPLLVSENGRSILLFPTKVFWRQGSRYEWIEEGLETFVKTYGNGANGKSFAFPMLGCGLGGLDKDRVVTLFHKHLVPEKLDIDVYIYDPK